MCMALPASSSKDRTRSRFSRVVPLGIQTFIGAVVVEQVFTLPGLGSLLLTGIQQRDYPTVQGVLLFSTLLVLSIGFLADLLQRIIDPRLRERVSNSANGTSA